MNKTKSNTFGTQDATVSDANNSKFGACTVREEESIMKTYREGPKSTQFDQQNFFMSKKLDR